MISKKQYKLLKRAKRKEILQTLLTKEERNLFISLKNLKMMKYTGEFTDTGFYIPEKSYIAIDIEGEAYIQSFRRESFRLYFPFIVSSVLSLIAIVISIIAITKANQPTQ